MKKGAIQFSVGTSIAALTIVGSALTSYYTALATAQHNLSETATVLNAKISDDDQRISKVEQALSDIKDSEHQIDQNIAIILNDVRKK